MRWTLIAVLVPVLFSCKEIGLVDVYCEPHPEVCNGIDDNCDGVVDNGANEMCSTTCGTGIRVCSRGRLSGCNAPLPRPEVCDGLDNDCDGIVDNQEQMPIEFCYSGASTDLIHSETPCSPGLIRCKQGHLMCVGQVLPSPEVCDGLDNNCNGKVDDGPLKTIRMDIVTVIDNSGSMVVVAPVIQEVVKNFQTKYAGRNDLRWALVAAPDKDINLDRGPTLQTNFTDVTQFSAKMGEQTPTGGGEEATLDAIDQLISPENTLGLNWDKEATKTIIVFSDEDPQAYSTAQDFKSLGIKITNAPFKPLAQVIVFTTTFEYLTVLQWKAVVGEANVYNINLSAGYMGPILEKIINKTSCVP